MSKESAAKTLSFLFQDNFSGRAEIGLTGDDDFHFKVSADGTAWLDALVIDRITGEVSFPHTDVGGPRLIPSNNLSDLASKKAGLDNINIHGADVASAATIDLDAATGVLVDITGATTVTAITLGEGRERVVRFTGALTLTHGAALVLPGGANITTAPGDFATLRGYAAGVVRVTQYAAAWRTPFPSAAEEIGELIQALTEDTAPVPSTDMLGGYDASADTGKKYLYEKLATHAYAGLGAVTN